MLIGALIRTLKRRTRSRFGDGSRFDGGVQWATRVRCASKFASVAPDANPYLVLYSIFKTGIDGTKAEIR